MDNSFSSILLKRALGVLLLLVCAALFLALIFHQSSNPNFSNASTDKYPNLLDGLSAYVGSFLLWLFDFLNAPLIFACASWAVILLIFGRLTHWRVKILFLLFFLFLVSIGFSESTGLWGKIINKEALSFIPERWHVWAIVVSIFLASISYLLALFSLKSWARVFGKMIAWVGSAWRGLAKQGQLLNQAPAQVQKDEDEGTISGTYDENLPSIGRPKKTTTNTKPNQAPKDKPAVTWGKKQMSQPDLTLGAVPGALPPLSLLAEPSASDLDHNIPDENLQQNAELLDSVLKDFGVRGEVVAVKPGPVVTLYEFEPAPGTRSQRVIGLADDIARSLGAMAARVAVIPGRNAIGIELPNADRKTVFLRELLESKEFNNKGSLNLVLGKTIGGDPVSFDLAKMPHLLIAGTTGSGKSVAINTFILSLLYRLRPEQCRMIMVDPKMLELSIYEGIPHLLAPVVTDPKKAVMALRWVVREMEERYKKMSKLQVRNIAGYNERMAEAEKKGETLTRTIQTGFHPETGEPILEEEELGYERMPYIVVVIDEMADLMMVAGKEVEAAIQRLAQMARAAGIHMIMATQRPSVDVITGTIKANFPTRISFQVTSRIDSRTILDEMGAEQLLGRGDMLFRESGGRVRRLHGPFVSDEEVNEIVTFLKETGTPDYSTTITEPSGDEDSLPGLGGDFASGGGDDEERELFNKAVDIVARDRKASTSYIQRKLSIGYNRAARIIEQMEEEGIVGSANHVGKREILVRDPNE